LKLSVGHWGAVDGKNDWKDCEVAVIFGLPYMDPRRAINNVFAVQGPQDDTWLKSPIYKQHTNVLHVMMQRQLSVSVIQAINRIRCRCVIDTEGRCPKADAYIVLPKDWRGDAVLDDIVANMPGIKVAPWDFEPDGPKVYAPRSNSASAGVIALMRDRMAGPTPLPYIQRQLSLSKKQMARLREHLGDMKSNVAKALREIGVTYLVTGAGRGSKCFLVKHAMN
jgi:hypothetical protein